VAQATVDFAAVGRVSKYAELTGLRLIELSAKADPTAAGPLQAEFAHNCAVASRSAEQLGVTCEYRFGGKAGDLEAVRITVKLLLQYALKAPEAISDADVAQFAIGNGALHSWPFVREILNSLTFRMGFPPFMLGVLHFVPQQPATTPQQQQGEQQSATPTPK